MKKVFFIATIFSAFAFLTAFTSSNINNVKTEELMAGICGCISERFDLNGEVRTILDALYPKESGLIIVIEGSNFRFETTYGG